MQRALLIFSEDFPPDLLEATRKTASVFLDLSRETKNSSKIPTLFLKALYGSMPTSAHADCTDFTEIFGEFETPRWADVGIGPYSCMRKCIRIRRKSI